MVSQIHMLVQIWMLWGADCLLGLLFLSRLGFDLICSSSVGLCVIWTSSARFSCTWNLFFYFKIPCIYATREALSSGFWCCCRSSRENLSSPARKESICLCACMLVALLLPWDAAAQQHSSLIALSARYSPLGLRGCSWVPSILLFSLSSYIHFLHSLFSTP